MDFYSYIPHFLTCLQKTPEFCFVRMRVKEWLRHLRDGGWPLDEGLVVGDGVVYIDNENQLYLISNINNIFITPTKTTGPLVKILSCCSF